ncbi:MAG: LPS-assembly protein LptD, partial [candidate division WS1 bacterium]|nr:LPS-assembly protein LptD [candidate division WS1 bacterium]
YCDEAEYYDETDSAKATGNLRVVDPEATITGDLLTADFEEEIVVVTGNVRVVAQKKSDEEQGTDNGAQQTNATGQQTTAEQSPASDDSKSARKSDEPERLEGYAERVTTITCDELEYHYNEDIRKAYAAGKVKAVQEDKTVWADNAVYDQIADEITLTGNVRLKTDDGDELLTQEATVSIAEDWIRTGQVSGVTFRRKSESKED